MKAFSMAMGILLLPSLGHGRGGEPLPAQVAPRTGPSSSIKGMLREVDAALARTELGRRLLAATEDIPLMELRDPQAEIVRYLFRERRIAFNPDRFKSSSDTEIESAFIRERTRASVGIPINLVEDQQAAFQAELEYAVEKASIDPGFDRSLRAAYERAKGADRGRRAERERILAVGVDPGPLLDQKTPHETLERLGTYLYLFSEDPDLFYWVVERDQVRGPALRYSELADFLAAHQSRLAQLSCPESGLYCWLDGRSYPRRLVDGAREVRDESGLSRLRESIGLFQTKVLPILRVRVNRWVRAK